MKSRFMNLVCAATLASSAVLLPIIASAEATLSGNAGILSDYIFRGIPQNDSSGNGGVDLEFSGFYAGTWVADVGEGVEWDLYGGYKHEFSDDETQAYVGIHHTFDIMKWGSSS